ncbi:uncharacterized protein MELLADRAFT_70444 [Melampsora larici-populina 98AG31]|uniref:Uncharacterized protein n=1 Tax=Melampsora larici-populina (strain 98AG31 / pathotype 3-4-7) TaxID=747676 RepID=F4R3S2_MELLP|nr:uncharacterized protein MELLADRAFT_70444 [Melampsora larici-populina 98AG31]EGG12677.1 hypothetical protein MELLADRAFT_70444 [Melampsora larici-populina 98AG31]
MISKRNLMKPMMTKSYSEPIITQSTSKIQSDPNTNNLSQPNTNPTANRNGKRDRSALNFASSSRQLPSHHPSFIHPFLQSPSSLSYSTNCFTFSVNPQPVLTTPNPTPSPSSSSSHPQSLMVMTRPSDPKHPIIKSNKLTDNLKSPSTPSGFWSDIKKTIEQYDPSELDEIETDELQERQSKRRKSVACTILDSALEVALFTSAIGYVAFQLWKGNRLNESPSQTRLPRTPVLPTSPPPPYEQYTSLPIPAESSTPVRPRLMSKRSSQRKVTHIHTPRTPRNPRSYQSTLPTKPIPTQSIESITESFHQQLKLNEEEDLMGEFIPSMKNYILPPTPLMEEPIGIIDTNEEDDLEILAFKDKIQSLIKSGHAALASKPSLSDESGSITHQTLNQFDHQFHQFNLDHTQPLHKKPNEIIVLENALDQTLKRTGKSWWET